MAVEFALVLPIFLLLIFGAVQYGWYFFQSQEGSFGAREGARAGAVGTVDSSELATLVNARIVSTDTVSTTTCFIDEPDTPSGYSVGDTLRVTVTFTAVNFNFPFLPFPGDSEIVQVVETRIEDTAPSEAATDEC